MYTLYPDRGCPDSRKYVFRGSHSQEGNLCYRRDTRNCLFWQDGIMLIILLFKNKQMFCYDQETITVRDKSIKLDPIKNVEEENHIPTGYLGIKTPAYMLNAAGGERIYIPTFYVISKKDYPVNPSDIKRNCQRPDKKIGKRDLTYLAK